jgi:hypothetical protein
MRRGRENPSRKEGEISKGGERSLQGKLEVSKER